MHSSILAGYMKKRKGVEQDYKKAYECYKKSAEQGDAGAYISLGWLYEDGNGVEQDYESAFICFLRAACVGDDFDSDIARCELGYLELEDYIKVIEYLEKFADLGDSYAQCKLGWLYENGYGVEQNYDKAIELYMKVADHGDVCEIAQENLVRLYKERRNKLK